jgi:hypothetical protein
MLGSGPKILFVVLASLLGLTTLIFVYYMYAVKFDENKYLRNVTFADKPDALSPERLTPVPSLSSASKSVSKDTQESNKQTPQTTSKPVQCGPEVFNIGENVYAYDDAEAVCLAHGAKLATYDQMIEAYKKGADWCNYGWVKGQLALYPTQKKTWLKLQRNPPEKRDVCGQPGLNGGYFDNKHIRLGVNCYGIKPTPKPRERIKKTVQSDYDAELQSKINAYKKEKDSITIVPFNQDHWSSHRSS